MGKFCLFYNRMHYLYNPKDSNIFINMLFSCKFSKLIGVCVVFYLYVVPVIFFCTCMTYDCLTEFLAVSHVETRHFSIFV